MGKMLQNLRFKIPALSNNVVSLKGSTCYLLYTPLSQNVASCCDEESLINTLVVDIIQRHSSMKIN